MKPILQIILVLTLSLFLNSCKKDKSYPSFFYTNTESETPLYLYIDGENKGLLPLMKMKPTSENDSLKQKALYMILKTGKYKVEAKEANGTVKSSGTIKFSRNRSTSTGNMGGQSMDVSKDCLIVGLW